MPNTDHLPITAAEKAVADLEALKPGAWVPGDERSGSIPPWHDALRAAERAIDELYHQAVMALFPPVLGSADAVRVLEFHAAGAGWGADALANLHALAGEAGNVELQELIRSAGVLRRLERQGFGSRDHAAALALLIARQLVDDEDLSAPALAIAETVPALRGRTGQAIKRLEAEALARARVELSRWFRELPHLREIGLDVGLGRHLAGPAVADLIDAGDAKAFEHGRWFWLHNPRGGGLSAHGHRIFS